MNQPSLDDFVKSVPPDRIPALIVALGARLLAEPVAVNNGNGAGLHPPVVEPDDTLDAAEIAKLLKRNRRWVYRSQRRLPFLRRVGRGLVCSRHELERWLAAQRIK